MKKICYHIKCGECEGQGHVIENGREVDCWHCHGAGIHCFLGELIMAADQEIGKNIYHIDLEPLKDSSAFVTFGGCTSGVSHEWW